MFGAGGGTSSYEEVEQADLIVLWGSNAREAHPIFFHHVLKAVRNGARLIVVDPRRTATAAFADLWLGLDVGTDIALSNTVAREILAAGLEHRDFIARATTGFDAYAASVQDWTLERGAAVTGVPAEAIRELAHAYATADRAILCWTLGITEHHNAVDNVLALIDLGLLTGHVGRYGSGLNPLRGQNNVQGGGDMGAIPNKLPGFQDIEKDADARARFEAAWGVPIEPRYGWTITQQFDAMERGDLTALYVIGENPASSEADNQRTRRLLEGLDTLVVQDIFLTRTAELADVVLPASNAAFETEGTVTNSERRVQRVRKALNPPGEAKDDILILAIPASHLSTDERMGALHLMGQRLADVVQQSTALGMFDGKAQLSGHDAGKVSTLHEMSEDVLTIRRAITQSTQQCNEVRMNVSEGQIHHGILTRTDAACIDLKATSLVFLLNARGLDATIGNQCFESNPGDLSSHRVE